MYNEYVQDSDGLLQGSWMTKQVQCRQQAAGVPLDKLVITKSCRQLPNESGLLAIIIRHYAKYTNPTATDCLADERHFGGLFIRRYKHANPAMFTTTIFSIEFGH